MALLILEEVIECPIAQDSDLNNTEVVPYCLLLAIYSMPSLRNLSIASRSTWTIKALFSPLLQLPLKE